MEITSRKNVVESNGKLQASMKRIERFKSLSSSIRANDQTIEFMKGIRTSASKLMGEANVASRKVEILVSQVETRKRHTSGKTSQFGKLVGKIGNIWGMDTPEDVAQVLEDEAKPMVKQILETVKGVIDAMDKACSDAISGMERVKQTSIDGARRLNEQAKSIVLERTTSMATKV